MPNIVKYHLQNRHKTTYHVVQHVIRYTNSDICLSNMEGYVKTMENWMYSAGDGNLTFCRSSQRMLTLMFRESVVTAPVSSSHTSLFHRLKLLASAGRY